MEIWPEARSQFGYAAAAARRHPRYDDNHRWNYLIEQTLKLDWNSVRLVNHIDAHAASSYFASPFNEAVVLVAEGGTGIYHGQGTSLRVRDRVGYLGDARHPLRSSAQITCEACERGLPGVRRQLPIQGKSRKPRRASARRHPTILSRICDQNARHTPGCGTEMDIGIADPDVIIEQTHQGEHVFDIVIAAAQIGNASSCRRL